MKGLFTRTRLWVSCCLLFSMSSMQLSAQKVLLVGDATMVSGLPAGEQNAYNWALAQYGSDAAYASFGDVASTGLPADCRVVWFHFEDDPALPASAAGAASVLKSFVEKGGGLVTTSFAALYMSTVDPSIGPPSEVINNDPRNADAAWGIRPVTGQEMHPVFEGLPASMWPDPNWGGTRTIADGTPAREAIAWYTADSLRRAGGTPIGTAPFFVPPNGDWSGIGEFDRGLGKYVFVSLPGYSWIGADTNGVAEQANLEQFTQNTLNYSTGPETFLWMVGGAADTAGLDVADGNAYDWALGTYGLGAAYSSLDNIAMNGIPDNVRVIWFHTETGTLPASAASAASAIEAFVKSGGSLYLTGTTPQMVYDIHVLVQNEGVLEVIENPRNADLAMGIRPTVGAENHPIYNGINPSIWPDPNWAGFRTIADTVPMKEAVAWWTQNSFPGTKLGTAPFIGAEDIIGVGEFKSGLGNVLVASLPAINWGPRFINGVDEQANLNKFTDNCINYLHTGTGPSVVLMGVPAGVNDLEDPVKNAYTWALDQFGAKAAYATFADVAANGIPASVRTVWYYHEDSIALPSESFAVAGPLKSWVEAGNGGVLLTGFAAQYVDTLGVMPGPGENINNPRVADLAQGIRPFTGTENHPIFEGLPASGWPDANWKGFRTVADGVPMKEAISWWNPPIAPLFPGTALGTAPFITLEDIVGLGEIPSGNGIIIPCALPGYTWPTGNPDTSQMNVELFTHNMLTYVSSAADTQAFRLDVMGGGKEIGELDIDGSVIEIKLTNAVFRQTIFDTAWTISGLPGGVSTTITRISDDMATIALAGPADDFDTDSVNFTVSIPASEFLNLRATDFTSKGEIIFKAFIESSNDAFGPAFDLRIAPNPATHTLRMVLDGEQAGTYEVRILTLTGQVIKMDEIVGTSRHQMSIADLAPGLYLLQLSQKGKTLTRKFVKQ